MNEKAWIWELWAAILGPQGREAEEGRMEGVTVLQRHREESDEVSEGSRINVL